MMKFMRKYEKYFFIVITVVIVISFSFFGTYSALAKEEGKDPVVFTSISGKGYTRSEVEAMVRFLSTDNEDKLIRGGAWGPNFLNNGVIRDDLARSGVLVELLKANKEALKEDLESRFTREKVFKFYEHPEAKFISQKNLLNQVSPKTLADLEALQGAQHATDDKALEARVNLFLLSSKVPEPLMRQFLKYQESQYDWIDPDPNLNQISLSLFGYQSVEDWMGPKFMRLVAEFIINSSEIAEKRGYAVSDDEAWADLVQNADSSFRQISGSVNTGMRTSLDYLKQQIQLMGLDVNKAIALWKEVLLTRRLFNDVKSSVVIDERSLQPMVQQFTQTANGTLYQLDEPFWIKDTKGLAQFEAYIFGVSGKNSADLAVPETMDTAAKVKERAPELVAREVKLSLKGVSLDRMQSNVSIKQMWDWQSKESSWQQLIKEFPELGVKGAKTEAERVKAIDALSKETRKRVDTFSREQIVLSTPNFVDKALESAPWSEMTVSLRESGGKFFLPNIKDRKELVKQLMTKDEITKYAVDNKAFYTIKVQERSSDEKVIDFKTAKEDGTLDQVAARLMAGQDAAKWLNPVLEAIQKESKETLIPAIAATRRFIVQARNARELALLGKEPKSLLSGQMVWKNQETEVDQQGGPFALDPKKIFSLKPGEWTDVSTPANGAINFFQLTSKGDANGGAQNVARLVALQGVVGEGAETSLAKILLEEMVKKGALSVSWMNR